ncbi:hypothetical protein [Caldimonas brevitalea]|uniref:Uncharacterized protein n=1 Tax=Caldimonas brevitalea TaxID=413882 RepID=A0A0G3BLT9_9BURK|nr:hypothetical protein [Caldimonas brevitalea]AKJ27525.1 hypothetical protein AAW51_0834 [Caldimonas brevitalea]
MTQAPESPRQTTDRPAADDAELKREAWRAAPERNTNTSPHPVPEPRLARQGSSTPAPEGGWVSPEVRSDADGPLRGSGDHPDLPSGTPAGHDTGGANATGSARRSHGAAGT